MKISGYYKEQGNTVKLITEWDGWDINDYNKIYLSKVFTDTEVPQKILDIPHLEYGGDRILLR